MFFLVAMLVFSKGLPCRPKTPLLEITRASLFHLTVSLNEQISSTVSPAKHRSSLLEKTPLPPSDERSAVGILNRLWHVWRIFSTTHKLH